MANKKSAAKRARQTEILRVRNTSVRTSMKSAQKRLQSAVASGEKPVALAAYNDYAAKLDKAAKRGVIHKNAANRRKSRMNALVARSVAA